MIFRLLAAMVMASLAIYFVMPGQTRLVKITAEEEFIHGGDRGARGNFKTVWEADRGAGFSPRPFSYAAIGAVVLNILRFLCASLGLNNARQVNSPRGSTTTRGDSGICTAEGSLDGDATPESAGSVQDLDRNVEVEDANDTERESEAKEADNLAIGPGRT